MRNILIDSSVKINANADIRNSVEAAFNGILCIYSYIIYTKYKHNILQYYQINFMISGNDKYNELQTSDVINQITNDILNNNSRKRIIGYKQPSIESLLILYEPMINTICVEEWRHWEKLELDDLKQTCKLIMIKLYKNGYYIHKRLVRKSFVNEILMSLRHEREKPTMISLENCNNTYDFNLIELVPDESEMLEDEEFHNKEALQRVIEMKRDIIIEYIGQRQYDQLIREYSNKSTTAWSRKLVYTIKQYLEKIGISENDFKRYY